MKFAAILVMVASLAGCASQQKLTYPTTTKWVAVNPASFVPPAAKVYVQDGDQYKLAGEGK